MEGLMSKKDETLFDVRIVNRNIKDKLIKNKDYVEFLKKLPDVTDKGTPLVFDEDEETTDTNELEEGQEVEQTDTEEGNKE